jgi:energy-coupling factor transport system ATP-binding protein
VTRDVAPLEVRNVRIRHDDREGWTPDGASFTVTAGEVVLLLGPSGSGKSTLALALNGLIPQAIPATLEGSVLVAGHSTTDVAVGRLSEHVAMVFQDPDSQIVTGTLLDEVSFGPENLLVPVDEVLVRAERALRQVGLWERRTENPDRLSGGGRQRLAIACALALGSPLIVLDEPTANLDPAGIEEVYAVLRDLVATGGHTIVLIEHNLDAAIDLVDRAVVIDRDGRLAFDGPVRETLLENVDALLAMGVWLPVSTLAALRLRAAGVPIAELPLTPRELTAAVDAVPVIELVEISPMVSASEISTGSISESGSISKSGSISARGSISKAAVSVRNLTVKRGKSVLLRDVNLEIDAGEFVAIVGVNGAGKTTLLQAIAGVVAPPKRTVTVGGVDPATADVRALAASIGFVFQNPEHQFIRTTVAEELAHGLEIARVDRAEIDARVTAMLERFGLEAERDVHPFLLSGGQKRRLSVGTALIAGAPILALDEPTFGQDRERATALLDLLAQLNDEGTTVLVVTHDMQLVADYSSRIAIVGDGRLLAYGATTDVLAGDALEAAGLRLPPLARAMRGLTRHPSLTSVSRLAQLS